jgi:hypothetical protein
MKEKMVVFYDEARNRVGMLLEIISDRQGDLIKYLQDTYSRVRVIVEDNWMRLDFDDDGKVGLEDIREALKKLVAFLREFDYLNATK